MQVGKLIAANQELQHKEPLVFKTGLHVKRKAKRLQVQGVPGAGTEASWVKLVMEMWAVWLDRAARPALGGENADPGRPEA